MSIERDSRNPNITIVHTPQGNITFDFGDEDRVINVNINKIPTLNSFDEKGRRELEALMDKTFNPPADSTEAMKNLQAKFNETIIATQHGKPLEIGTSEKLTSLDTGGGGLTRKVDAKDQPIEDVALGINLAEVVITPYKDNLGRKHFMHAEDILRHELFHYVDKASDPYHVSTGPDDPANAPLFKERRAVWFVNQFQLAENPPRAQRISYSTPDFNLDAGLAGADEKVAGKRIPGESKGYPVPSPENHRIYSWNKQAETGTATELADRQNSEKFPDFDKYAKADPKFMNLLPQQQLIYASASISQSNMSESEKYEKYGELAAWATANEFKTVVVQEQLQTLENDKQLS